MNRVFDIMEYGAVGDGSTDSTAAVQAALDAAADGGGKVVVPPGVYRVGRLTMRGKGVALEGTSAWGFRNDGASVFQLNTEDTDCMIDITGAFGCAIRGMSLNGGRLGESIHGVKLYWEKYNGGSVEDSPLIDDCRISSFTGDGLHFEHVWYFSVRHSMLASNRGAGLYIDGWDAFILDNWFSGNHGGGILGGPCAVSLTCTGNRVEWNRKGGFVLKNGSGINITGNFFDRSYGPALELGSGPSTMGTVTVTGNIFRRSGAVDETVPLKSPEHSSHVLLNGCVGTVITGNTMRIGQNDSHSGPFSPDYSFIVENCRSSIIKDNVMLRGAMKENLVIKSGNEDCVIEGNIGCTAEEQ